MLKIYLCEDNPKQREILSKYINNMILIDDYDIQFVKATDDPHEILELIDSERSTGLYFLDIDLSSVLIKLLTGYISVSSMHIPDIHQRITALTRIL